MAILKPKSANKTRTLSVRLPTPIVEEVEQVKRLADERGLLFDVSEIVEKAVSSAIKTARAELEASPAAGA
ncbi:MAG: hypothetical protein M1547_03090 [Gammaproteobacteria bacterium]|nr:hypothetical protein [Gammaproteobacteria bacterium]